MESQEKAYSEPIVTNYKKNEKDINPGSKINIPEKPEVLAGSENKVTKILRGLEILIIVVLLILTVFLILAKGKRTLNTTSAILLIALFATYLFVLSIDMFRRLTRRISSDTPMFLLAVLGFFLFLIAAEGIYLGIYKNFHSESKTPKNLLLVIIVLCAIEAILFLVDVGIIILHWRRAYTRVDKCPIGIPESSEYNIQKPADNNRSQRSVWISDPLVYKEDVRHVTTSVSDYERPSHPDLVNLHKFRKIGVGHRREYTDRPVSAQPAIPSRVVEAQTEPPPKKIVSDVESLVIAETKEEPVQTMPKCPVCANNWNPQGNQRADNFGLCPTFLHLTQGFGMCNCGHPASPGLRQTPVLRTSEASEIELTRVTKNAQKPSVQGKTGR